MYTGSYQDFLSSDTLTANYLNRSAEINANPRPVSEFMESRKSTLHNLKNVSLSVPKGIFTVITGVAGSGKSTLVNEVFAKDFPEAIRIDQSPVHANIRSNPATFTGIMNSIRKSFQMPMEWRADYSAIIRPGAVRHAEALERLKSIYPLWIQWKSNAANVMEAVLGRTCSNTYIREKILLKSWRCL